MRRGRSARGDVLDRRHQRLGLHHHALATAVGHVVHLQVATAGVVAQLVQRHLQHAELARPLERTDGERPAEHLGEERDDVDVQRQSSRPGQRIDARRAARRGRWRAHDVGDDGDQVLAVAGAHLPDVVQAVAR